MKILLLLFALLTLLFFYPSDGASFTRKLGNCRKNGYKTAVFHCKKKCIIKSASLRFKRGGNADIVGRDGRRLFTPLRCGRKCFCRGFTPRAKFEKCFKKKGHSIRRGIVSFVMKCKKRTRNLKITVNGNIRLHKKKTTATPKDYELTMEIGDVKLNEFKSTMVRCNGNCEVKDLYATFKKGGDIELYASTNYIREDIKECRDEKCVCYGEGASDVNQTCSMVRNVSGNYFHILVFGQKDTSNVKLYHRNGRFFSFHPFKADTLIWREIGDMAKNKREFFKVTCYGTCIAVMVKAKFPKGGNVRLHASESSILKEIVDCADRKCICTGQNDPLNVDANSVEQFCDMKNSTSSNSFYIMVEALKQTDKVFLGNLVGRFLSINPFTPDRVKEIGNMAKDDRKYFKVDCNGKCSLKKFYATFNGDVDLIVSESSSRSDIIGCAASHCICLGEGPSNMNENCLMQQNVTGNFFNILVTAVEQTSDVKLYLRVEKFSSLGPFTPV